MPKIRRPRESHSCRTCRRRRVRCDKVIIIVILKGKKRPKKNPHLLTFNLFDILYSTLFFLPKVHPACSRCVESRLTCIYPDRNLRAVPSPDAEDADQKDAALVSRSGINNGQIRTRDSRASTSHRRFPLAAWLSVRLKKKKRKEKKEMLISLQQLSSRVISK